MNVLIVGAGPTGLTAAVELARLGVDVRVIDRRESGSGLSRAVGIMPRSLEILRPSGVTEKLLAEGMRFRELRVYRDARPVLALPLAVRGAADDFVLGLVQDRTEAILRDALIRHGGSLSYAIEMVGLQQDADGVVIETKDGAETQVDYVIGADGIGSATREGLGVGFPGHDLPETWSIN